MTEVRQALFKKGYVLVIIGGSITGDIQINDTNCHHYLKKKTSRFRDEIDDEATRKNPITIPSLLRNEIMSMLLQA